MTRRVLITGGTGLLGQALLSSASSSLSLFGTYLPDKAPSSELACPFFPLDVRDVAQVAQVFDRVRPDLVIHAASIGSVDYSEHHREESWAVNVGGTQNVGRACARHHAKLIFISSNAVFDGEHPFYAEDAPVNPINYYGQLKVEGEEWVKSSGLDYAIVRPILMYGWHLPIERGNWVTSWLLCPPKVFLNPISLSRLLKVAMEVFAKLKQAIKSMKIAIIGGARSAAGCNDGNRLDDHMFLELEPTSLSGTRENLFILKSSLALF